MEMFIAGALVFLVGAFFGAIIYGAGAMSQHKQK